MRLWIVAILFFVERGSYLCAFMSFLGLVCEMAYDMIADYDDKPVALADINLFPPTL